MTLSESFPFCIISKWLYYLLNVVIQVHALDLFRICNINSIFRAFEVHTGHKAKEMQETELGDWNYLCFSLWISPPLVIGFVGGVSGIV